jgi:putative FmdB family regulatory protein
VPTYEYECRQCGRRFEVLQSMKDAPLTRCEACGGEVKRLISGGVGLLFKGSGFYQTDYRSAAYKKRAREDSGGAGKGGAKGDAGGKGGEGKAGEGKTGGAEPKSGAGDSKPGATKPQAGA